MTLPKGKADKKRKITIFECQMQSLSSLSFQFCFVSQNRKRNSFFIKVQLDKISHLEKKRLHHQYFPVNFAKYSITIFLEHLQVTASDS